MFDISNNKYNSKEEMYAEIMEYAEMLMFEERDYTANLANISALLNQVLKDINWVGFYIARGNQLVLGPFQGKVACIRIDKGRGVCGVAFDSGQTQLIANVHQFPGHIACDSASDSEVVVPININSKVVAVLDIDSPIKNRFDEVDKKYLETLCLLIKDCCDWHQVC